ncbi:MAG TPA: glutamate--cysteine ligase [Pilimelia sp.]|nr:glutamate--cysteine ligase [Pilimelia sp.]
MTETTPDASGRPVEITPPPELLTVGVEEEFLLVDPGTGRAVPAVEEVYAQVPPQLRGQVQHEFVTMQIEIGSAPVVGLDALGRSLRALREALAAAADRAGVRLVAIGTAPVGGDPAAPVVDMPRYHRMADFYGALTPRPGLNGLHVHVGIADRETGVQVINHLRPWLPLLQAATANSPYFDGTDTGHASWRSVLWNMWPTVGPPPYLSSAEEYDDLLARLIDTGAMLDEGMLYWYARLSSHLPTVELRLGDVCPTVDDSLLLAALVRGLVATVLADVGAGREAERVPHHLLTAAHWRAAHDGLEGGAVDPLTGRELPAWELLRRLVDRVTPALERHGDLAAVTLLLGRLRAHGTGAARQRALVERAGDVAAVLPYLADATRG